MSYCVECGVELENGAASCPLCDTPVVNPRSPKPDGGAAARRAYSGEVVLPAGIRRRYVAFLISVSLAIPNIICVIANLLYPDTGVWALYAVSSSTLAWVLFVQPFFWKKVNPYFLLALDTVAVTLYIYIFFVVKGETAWFYRTAVPLVAVLAVCLATFVFWFRLEKRDWPRIVIAVLSLTCVYSACAGIILHTYLGKKPVAAVSLIVCLSCAVMIGFFVYVTRNKRFRAWLSRRFFV